MLLLCLLLGGCSGAVRLQRFEIEPSAGWQAAKDWQTYQCGQSSMAVRRLRTARLIIVGPIVPLLPMKNEDSGDFEVWSSGSISCPVIVQQGKVLEAREGEPGKNACLYDQNNLDITKSIELRVVSDAEQCTTNPVQYEKKTDWTYCLMCTR